MNTATKKMSCSLKPLVPFYDLKRPIQWKNVFKRKAPLTVEIGFGLGEVLVEKAFNEPDVNFVGIETHWERIYKTLKRIDRQEKRIENIKVLRADATVALERLFDQKSIDHMYCLFPCPWPKKKHTKHRLFSNSSLRLINSRLRNKAQLYIVTDFYPYTDWIDEESQNTGFDFSRGNITSAFGTKFEKKWRAEGQQQFSEINLTKNKHIKVDVKKDIKLKTYKVNHFDPETFSLEKETGEVTIIFRSIHHDSLKNETLIHLLVAEEHLTQDFWVLVKKKNNSWLIQKAEGHYFFPTPAIAKALHCVYETVKKNTN